MRNRWSKLQHPSVVSLRDCFLSNGAVFFVHDFYPSATSLFDRFLKARLWPIDHQNAPQGCAPVAEDILWSVAIQLLSALQAIHSYGLACRSLDCKHVLETERNGLNYRNASVQLINVGLCHRL